MSNPSFSNIELWLFELAEGNLSPRQIEQLELFLLQNPELDVDRDVWEMAKVAKQAVPYPDEEKLLKKRPVGWYVGGSVALTTVLALLWFLVPQFAGENELLSRNSDRTEVRVFVIQRDAPASASESNTELSLTGNEMSEVPAMLFAQQVSAQQTPQNLPSSTQEIFISDARSAENPARAGNHDAQVVGNLINTSELQATTMQAAAGIQHTPVTNDPFAATVHSSNGQEEGLTQTALSAFMLSEVDQLPTDAAQAMNQSYELELAPMRLSREQQIYQEEALAHHFQERTSSNENGTTETTVARPTYSSGYHTSLKSKMNTFGRKIQRMMDNPVALKNFKDPHFHVPGMLPNDINFSSAGTMLSSRVQTLSRVQWLGQENEQLMNQLSFDGYAYAVRGGVGIQLNHGMYRDGGISVASAAITYSPKLSISRKVSFEPSLRFKMGNKTLANSKMQGIDQVEVDRGNTLSYYPGSKPIGKMLWYQDLGVGLMVNTEWFYAGVQVDNLFRHDDNIYDVDITSARRAPNHFVATIGTDWVSKRENLSLSPYVVYQNYGQLSEGWAGLNFRMSWFTLGASVSSSLEPAASIGLKFDHFALTYNADYTKSVMTGAQALSHQLTLRFVSKPSRFGKRLLNL